jgi:hypothetical protein
MVFPGCIVMPRGCRHGTGHGCCDPAISCQQLEDRVLKCAASELQQLACIDPKAGYTHSSCLPACLLLNKCFLAFFSRTAIACRPVCHPAGLLTIKLVSSTGEQASGILLAAAAPVTLVSRHQHVL